MIKLQPMKPFIFIIIFFTGIICYAQDEIIFLTSELEPHEEGYYKTGVWVDEFNNGVLVHHDSCEDYYENYLAPQDNHVETGKQQDFEYITCMIMPDCPPKGTPIDPPVANGYIQMAPGLNLGTDSASISAIISPPVRNLVSMTLETSSDVSINENRKIPYNIDYSTDNGLTWSESVFITDYVGTQGGYRVTYDNAHSPEFLYMITESASTPIRLRISTNDVSLDRPVKGQYVKVHKITIIADLELVGIESVKKQEKLNITVRDKIVISEDNEIINVYNNTGQLIGKGISIYIENPGIYFVKSENKKTEKIFIK